MRLALASQPVRNGDVAWNVRCMEDVLRACSGRADTVVFGESVLQGFDCLRWDYARDCTVAAAWTDEPVRHLQAAARENGAAVSFGMIEPRGRWALQQSGLPRRGRRLIDVFRRVSVGWKDVRRTDRHYREGDGFHLFSYGGIRFATALCGRPLDAWQAGGVGGARRGCRALAGLVRLPGGGVERTGQARICRAGLALRLPGAVCESVLRRSGCAGRGSGRRGLFLRRQDRLRSPGRESGILFVEL